MGHGFSLGTAALGHEDSPTARVNFSRQIATNLTAGAHAVYVRIPFDVADISQLAALKLQLKYDNGFVAYLNGQRVASDNAPQVLDWFSTALDASRADSLALEPVEFDLTEHIGLLKRGTNVLSLHGLNNLATDRGDMLLVPRLIAAASSSDLPLGYLPDPTPGAANLSLAAQAGPLIRDVTNNPGALRDDQDLVVTARMQPLNAPLGTVALVYRVTYDPEVSIPMVDDGTSGDQVAGEGVFSAIIPHAASSAGQVVRWYVGASDTAGSASRAPRFLDRDGQSQSPEYFGTIIADGSIETQLPVIHWFVESPRQADRDQGTRASLFYSGEFYDNIYVRIRGGTARSWPKKSYKVEFNDGHLFRLHEDVPRVDEINLNAAYTDKSYVRSILAAETHRDAGTPSPESFHVRLQQNGQFFSVAILVEQPDRRFLARYGLDENGALYKCGPGSTYTSTGSFEKKTRTDEDKSDIRALLDGLRLEGDALEQFLFDNVNVSALVNFLASVVVTQNIDASDKNHHLFRDTEGSGEWEMLPWDLDLTFGPDALNTDVVIADENRAPGTTNPNAVHPFIGSRRFPLHAGKINMLQDRIIETPRTREMLLRRIRSQTDQFLATSYYDDRIDELIALIAKDVELDKARWGRNNHFGSRQYTLQEANDRLEHEYLVPRLAYLTHRQGELSERQGGVGIPESQIGNPSIMFGAVEFDPASGNQDEEYIELVNINEFAVDISGWQLTGGVEHTFKAGTVIPAGQSLYISPNVRVFRARASGPSGGQGLFVQGNYAGHLSREGESLTLLAADRTPVARTFVGGEPTDLQRFLRITEINFKPHSPNPVGGLNERDDGTHEVADRFEFIELANMGERPLEVAGARLSTGVEFTFAAGTSLAPGQRVVVVKDHAAFRSRYGDGVSIAGEFSGTLDDRGEHIFLDDAAQRSILAFAYRGDGDWPTRARGLGSSLEIVDPMADYAEPANWRSSGEFGGSPGKAPAEIVEPVVINEVLANPTGSQGDKIELHNAGGLPIDVSHWYVSDSDQDYFKSHIPAGTMIPAIGYQVFDLERLGLDLDAARGSELWLIAAQANGRPLRFVDHVRFGPSSQGISVGPWPESTSLWTQLAEPTLGHANTAPYVGPVIISELYFNPRDPDGQRPQVAEDFQFIELYNRSPSPMALAGWQVSGDVEFTFPAGSRLGPGESGAVVRFNPTDTRQAQVFRFALGMGPLVQLAGPFAPALNSAAGHVQLLRPDSPSADDPTFTPMIAVDAVSYDTRLPWPSSPDGSGESLARTVPVRPGSLPISWAAGAATPGAVLMVSRQTGDANGDGRFDQQDRVQIVVAGKYLTGQPASWADGDFNGDGVFDQRDLVAALQDRGDAQ